ncbi:unnamed protein product [Prorocentrum cordatum]|uniref:Phospholipase B-like n=1 Tax=Prorocentrum cordatum TaxID=2364126 RepID=A0ABN9U4X1_9DINO|nr:unnamed protein product [Polarella glacialis]
MLALMRAFLALVACTACSGIRLDNPALASPGAMADKELDSRPVPVPIASIAEAARARHSTGGIQFILPKYLGTVPCNRSGLGVSGYHVHEIVQSIKTDGLSRRRYRDATVVKVPTASLDEFREYNRRMCDGDDLLPPFDSSMRYALLTKNHFAHALKLYDCRSHFLNGTREVIEPSPHDKLSQHLAEGMACEVMREDLWADSESLEALVGEDNMDASTDLASSEIEAGGFSVYNLHTATRKTSIGNSLSLPRVPGCQQGPIQILRAVRH